MAPQADIIFERELWETVVTLRVTALDEFVRWALSFGRHAKVLSPRRVRDRIGEVLRGAAELYRA